jgi:hypothetical protein
VEWITTWIPSKSVLRWTQELHIFITNDIRLPDIPSIQIIDGKDIDTKVRLLLRSEYLRRLGRYRHVVQVLANKYGIQFDEFVTAEVVKEKGYSWEAEIDAMNWETAISGIKTMERKLAELRETDHVPH